MLYLTNPLHPSEPHTVNVPQFHLSLQINMPFSYHSHSGQFCRHAENLLEEVVQTAVRKQMDLYALTEHMPREEEDLYPEEVIALFPLKCSRAHEL